MKKCLQCNKMNSDSANFCTDCGSNLSQIEAIEVETSEDIIEQSTEEAVVETTEEVVEEPVSVKEPSSSSEKIINTERLKEASSEYFDQVQEYTKENKSTLSKLALIIAGIILLVYMTIVVPGLVIAVFGIGSAIAILFIAVNIPKDVSTSKTVEKKVKGVAEDAATVFYEPSQQSSSKKVKLSRGGYGFGYVYVVRILSIISVVLFLVLTNDLQGELEWIIHVGILDGGYRGSPSEFAVIIVYLIRFVMAGCIYMLFDIFIKVFENIARIARANDEIARILQDQNRPKF